MRSQTLTALKLFVVFTDHMEWFLGGVFVVLALTGAAFSPFRLWRLDRSTFFLVGAVIGLVATALASTSVDPHAVLRSGMFEAVLLLNLLGLAGLGFVFGVAGNARSRDAFGTGKWGFLAIVPIAILVLLFVPGREAAAGNQNIARATGYIALGLAIAVLSGVWSRDIDRQVRANSERMENDPEFQSLAANWQISRFGLSAVLARMEADFEPRQLANGLFHSELSAEEDGLVRDFEVDTEMHRVDSSLAPVVHEMVCGHSGLRTIIEAGGTIRDRYSDAEGQVLLDVETTSDECAD